MDWGIAKHLGPMRAQGLVVGTRLMSPGRLRAGQLTDHRRHLQPRCDAMRLPFVVLGGHEPAQLEATKHDPLAAFPRP